MALYSRSYRAHQAADSCRTWICMARWCRVRGDRGGAALALNIAGRFRRYASFILKCEGRT